MTTPPSEPDAYAGSGGSDRDVRDWSVPPAVPGWSAGQHFYTGPVFDDTGWHIDLSGIDWGDESDSEPDYDDEPSRRDRPPRRRATLRFRNPGPDARNGYAQPPGPAAGGPGGSSPRASADTTQRYPRPTGPASGQPGYPGYDYRPDGPPARGGRSSGRHAFR